MYYVDSYTYSRIVLIVHSVLIICDPCHTITIGKDTLSDVHFCPNIFIVLIILKLFI